MGIFEKPFVVAWTAKEVAIVAGGAMTIGGIFGWLAVGGVMGEQTRQSCIANWENPAEIGRAVLPREVAQAVAAHPRDAMTILYDRRNTDLITLLSFQGAKLVSITGQGEGAVGDQTPDRRDSFNGQMYTEVGSIATALLDMQAGLHPDEVRTGVVTQSEQPAGSVAITVYQPLACDD